MDKIIVKKAKKILDTKVKTLQRDKKEHRIKEYEKDEEKIKKATKPVFRLDRRFKFPRKKVEKA